MLRIELGKWLIHVTLPTVTTVSMSGLDSDFQEHTLLVSAPCSLITHHNAWRKKETVSWTLDTNSISIQLIALGAFLAHRYNSLIYFTQDVYSGSLIQCSRRFSAPAIQNNFQFVSIILSCSWIPYVFDIAVPRYVEVWNIFK